MLVLGLLAFELKEASSGSGLDFFLVLDSNVSTELLLESLRSLSFIFLSLETCLLPERFNPEDEEEDEESLSLFFVLFLNLSLNLPIIFAE